MLYLSMLCFEKKYPVCLFIEELHRTFIRDLLVLEYFCVVE